MEPDDKGIDLLRRSGGVVCFKQKRSQRQRPRKIKKRSDKYEHNLLYGLVVSPEESLWFELQTAYCSQIVKTGIVPPHAKVFLIHVTTPFCPKAASIMERATFRGIGLGS